MKQKGGRKMSSSMTATMPVLVIPSHSQHPTCRSTLALTPAWFESANVQPQ